MNRDDEEEHCSRAVCELADREGLVVITPEVVALLKSERAAVRMDERKRCLLALQTARELIEAGE